MFAAFVLAAALHAAPVCLPVIDCPPTPSPSVPPRIERATGGGVPPPEKGSPFPDDPVEPCDEGAYIKRRLRFESRRHERRIPGLPRTTADTGRKGGGRHQFSFSPRRG